VAPPPKPPPKPFDLVPDSPANGDAPAVPPKESLGAGAGAGTVVAAAVEAVAVAGEMGVRCGVSGSGDAKDESFGAVDDPKPLVCPAPSEAKGELPVASLLKPEAANALGTVSFDLSEAVVVGWVVASVV
jgi:hypothetical protein